MASNIRESKICSCAERNQSNREKKGKLTIQCDELWCSAKGADRRQAAGKLRFRVDNKGNKQWVWLALDAKTREIVGVYIGDRNESAARKLWTSLPQVYRQCAVAYTDFWNAYGAVLPPKRHRAQRIRAERPQDGLESFAFAEKRLEKQAMLRDLTTL